MYSLAVQYQILELEDHEEKLEHTKNLLRKRRTALRWF
jgi:hypothetical protein